MREPVCEGRFFYSADRYQVKILDTNVLLWYSVKAIKSRKTGIMEKHFQLVYLLDLYGGLLTEKQYHILNSYYNEDQTISEIAEAESVSRQAAFDLLKRTEKLLMEYDEKLQLLDKYLRNKETISRILQTCGCSADADCKKLLSQLEENL